MHAPERYGLDSDTTDAVFQALASATRRRMLDTLVARPGINVAQLADGFEMSRIGVLKHIDLLEDAGLVVSEKHGRERLLYFNATPIEMIHERWTTELSRHWAGALTQLKRAVELDRRTTRSEKSPWPKTTKRSSASRSAAASRRSGGS
jgi:DNA-binding transcriptional ArsR family regulator